MNRNIATLYLSPRAKPWRSCLIPHSVKIRRWRDDGVSYRQIAVLLREFGVHISASGVHDFIRVRDGTSGRRLYELPQARSECSACLRDHLVQTEDALSASTKASTQQSVVKPKKFVFQSSPIGRRLLGDDQLAINDPLQ